MSWLRPGGKFYKKIKALIPRFLDSRNFQAIAKKSSVLDKHAILRIVFHAIIGFYIGK